MWNVALRNVFLPATFRDFGEYWSDRSIAAVGTHYFERENLRADYAQTMRVATVSCCTKRLLPAEPLRESACTVSGSGEPSGT